MINLDELDPALSTENPEISTPPDTLTWILYTSGSAGRPKGVVQNHRNVLHFVKNYTNGLHICLREAFRLDLPLRALFEDPTVASLAMRIALLQTKQAEALASLESCSDEAAQFLLAQQRCVP